MKILLVNKYWRPAGGVEEHAFVVRDWLEAIGHEVIPFAMNESDTLPTDYREYFPSEVDFRGAGWRERLRGIERATISSESRKTLGALLRDHRVDAAYVLHTYHQLGTAILNTLASAGVPTVLSLHDYKITCPNYRLFDEKSGDICTRCLDSRFGYLVEPIRTGCWGGSRSAGVALAVEALFTRVRKSYQRPDVVTILNSLQRQAADHAGVDPAKVLEVPHPVELASPRAPGDRLQFAYVGRLVPEKGVDVLIEAAAISGTSVVIAGDGRSRADLVELVARLGADVTFVGQLDRAATLKLMRESIALVVPSTWHEVSPLVVYEAIANDVPVIATAVGGMVDQLDGGRGYLIPPADKAMLAQTLLAVASDQRQAQERSQLARDYAARTWSPESWEANMRRAFSMAGVNL